MSPKNASIEDSPKKIGFPSPGEIFDPVARALEVIGDRWTLVLIRQLLGGPKGFQELRMRTGIAPRVLSSRLKQLTDDGFVESVGEGPRSLYGQRSPMTSSARATGSKSHLDWETQSSWGSPRSTRSWATPASSEISTLLDMIRVSKGYFLSKSGWK